MTALRYNSVCLLTIALMAHACIGQSIQDDYNYCASYYSNRSSFLNPTFKGNKTMVYNYAQGSTIIRYFLNFSLIEYMKVNIVSLIPWLLLVSVSSLGWLCCCSGFLYNTIKKENFILTPMEKKKRDKEAAKAGKKGNKEKKGKKDDEDDEESENDEEEEDNFEDIDDPIKLLELSKLKNHIDFRCKLLG